MVKAGGKENKIENGKMRHSFQMGSGHMMIPLHFLYLFIGRESYKEENSFNEHAPSLYDFSSSLEQGYDAIYI